MKATDTTTATTEGSVLAGKQNDPDDDTELDCATNDDATHNTDEPSRADANDEATADVNNAKATDDDINGSDAANDKVIAAGRAK